MGIDPTRLEQLSPLQQAVAALKETQARLGALKSAKTEPIAIIGVGCRFPGGCSSPAAYWKLLREGVDAIREVPPERWDIDAYYDPDPATPEKMYSRWGGFLDGVDQFDAEFFGISRREAIRMDPQQRLLAEVAWEALERAGCPAPTLAQTLTGVFVGICHSDYFDLELRSREQIDAFAGTGGALSIAANRLSYLLNLRGPSLAVDTACSSSMVAVHLACQSLRRGESDMAIAGGVNLILVPDATIAFCKAQLLSPDGRCKTFDADADGYVRGEGCGLLVLKRLSDALSAGNPILALIRGSAVNHNGQSNGLSAPSGLAQQDVIRDALRDAQVAPGEIDYVEAHGTGTRLGDAIEAEALIAELGSHRPSDRPLMIGSVKTNIGHLEGASGIAGLIKAALALKHGLIPPHLNLETPNSSLAKSAVPVVIPTTVQEWPSGDGRRRAGVSSFGFGGANAHVILEEAPLPDPAENSVDRPSHVVTLSARNASALDDLVARYRDHLDTADDQRLADLAFSANTGRSHFRHRLAVVADSTQELRDRLQTPSTDSETPGCRRGKLAGSKGPKVAFLFTGQGSQYAGMGGVLLETQPTFRKAVLQCDEYFRQQLGQSLLGLFGSTSHHADNLLRQTGLTQPALFAIEYALAQMWRSWGIEPSMMMGHSLGEYAAACVAGVFSLEDGLNLVARRAGMMQDLPPGGSMAAVFASAETVTRALKPFSDQVTIAAFNGPQNVVISGLAESVEAICSALAAEDVKSKPLATSHAFHSALTEPMLDALEEAAGSVNFQTPSIRLISNLTGSVADDQTLTKATYWRDHTRRPVQFASGMQALAAEGCDLFLEIGPAPVLLGMGRRCLPEAGGPWLPSLRRGRDDWQVILDSLAALYTAGVGVDWSGFDRDYARRLVQLPTYPFQRRRFWPAGASADRANLVSSVQEDNQAAHPLLGHELALPLEETVFQSQLSVDQPALLSDHRVLGEIVMPGAAFVEMAMAAAASHTQGALLAEDIAFVEPLVFADAAPRTLQTVLKQEGEGKTSYRVFSLSNKRPGKPSFATHSFGSLVAAPADSVPSDEPTLDVERERSQFTGRAFGSEQRMKVLHASGMEPGPTFQWIEEHWVEGNEVLGRMREPQPADGAEDYQLHPGLIDCGFQLLAAALPDVETNTKTYVPASIGAVRVLGQPEKEAWYRCSLEAVDDTGAKGSIRLFDQDGRMMMEMNDVRLRTVPRQWLTRILSSHSESDWLYKVDWQPLPLQSTQTEEPSSSESDDPSSESDDPSPDRGSWLVFDAAGGLGSTIAAKLQQQGQLCSVHPPAAGEQIRDTVGQFLAEEERPRGIIHFAHQNLEQNDAAGTLDLDAARQFGWGSVLDLVQTLTKSGQARLPKLVLVTRGVQAVEDGTTPLALDQSPLWGLGRVVATEHPELACLCVDLDSAQDDNQADSLVAELLSGDGENQVAFRSGIRRVARLRRLDDTQSDRLTIPEGQPYQLQITHRGELGNVELRSIARRPPGPQDVEIEVRATGLNFRDVLNLLNLYPGDPGPLGGECSGEVVSVGDNVEGLSPGDRVMALAPGSFSSYVTTPAEFVVKIPEHLSFEEAATVPICFLTAHHALRRLGKVGPGDRVLIHAASGGVGLAAIQLAKKADAEIFATAGNDKKRDFLRSLGIQHVMDSRSLDFAEEITQATGGRGVNLVLNSLVGDSIAKSLSVLAPGGRFLEIGKNDLWDEDRAREVNPDVSFHAIALDQMAADAPLLIAKMLADLIKQFAAKQLEPLPLRTFGVPDVVSAFRHMARAEHIGKIVVLAASDSQQPRQPSPIRDDATYLVSGGLGGLGLQLAKWLVDRGARHLVLTSRSGTSQEAAAVIPELEQRGARVKLAAADVARQEDVARLLADVRQSMPPLCGVFHLAGVLDDGMLREQTRDRFRRVMSPKIEGAWNLHQLTRDDPLELFVLFSSVAALLGSPGQGNYAAANAFLDALASHRCRQNLPALAINWGPWKEIGMAAGMAARDRARWAASGIGMIAPKQGFEALGLLLQQQAPHVAVLPVDWARLGSQASLPPLLSNLASTSGKSAEKRSEFRNQLDKAPVGERRSMLISHIQTEAARVLGLGPSETIDLDQGFFELGVDSLMAVELKGSLEGSLGLALPLTLLMDYPTVSALVDYLAQELIPAELPPVVPEEPDPQAAQQPDRSAALDEMSEDQLANMLREKLSDFKEGTSG